MGASLILLAGREKSLLNRHPWVFSGAIAGASGNPSPGDVVTVQASDGRVLATGFYNPSSQIVFRALSWTGEDPDSPGFWRARLESALSYRTGTLGMTLEGRALRIANAESDGLPGLVADWYDGTLVLQFLCLGMDLRRKAIVEAASEVLSPERIYERSDSEVRRFESLGQVTGPLAGDAPPALVEIEEGARRFLVDVVSGHKTGFYLDQAANRLQTAPLLAGRTVLNCFGYTGAFAVHAAGAGSILATSVDSSQPSLALAARNAAINGLGSRCSEVCADVPEYLRALKSAGTAFGAVILDPPKFVMNKAGIEKGARGYKDINRVAMQVIEPGGILVTFSCSGHVDPDLFQKIVFSASVEAGRDARIVAHLRQSPDHPVLLSYPEGTYLKGLVCCLD